MPEENVKGEELFKVIQEWNNNNLDLFEISPPDQNMEFHGVMRFYLEDASGENVATKCLRVSSVWTTEKLLLLLSQKISPDVTRLSDALCLWEVQAGKERKLEPEERPLVVQLNWNKSNRDGRFVLKTDEDREERNAAETNVIQNLRKSFKKHNSKLQNRPSIFAHRSETQRQHPTLEPHPGVPPWSPTLEPGLGLRLECERLVAGPLPTGPGWAQPERKDVGLLWAHPPVGSSPAKGLIGGSCEEDWAAVEDGLKESYQALLARGTPEAADRYHQAKRAAAHAVTEAKAWGWEEFEEAMEKDLEDSFLSAVINHINSSTLHFKLSPAFVLYAAARSLLCPHTGSGARGQRSRVTALTDKMVDHMRRVIQRSPTSGWTLCFWMSNLCELLHFLKRDSELQPITEQSQTGMSRLLHHTFRSLVEFLQKQLVELLPMFLLEPQTHGALPKGIESIVTTLMTSMSLFRRCKLHAALSIQLFSHLFHFISLWLFRRLLAPRPEPAALRSHQWGATLRHRLAPIEAWAERQGLELAADCYLGLIIQATVLLTSDPCVEVRPVHIQALLQEYNYRPHERDSDWVAGLVSVDRLDVPLEESLTLQQPLLLPEHGYCSQALQGVPPGLTEFMETVCKKGVCSVTPQPLASGDWTVHFGALSCEMSDLEPRREPQVEPRREPQVEPRREPQVEPRREPQVEPRREPQVETVALDKPQNSGLGLSIVAAKGADQTELGIYIKSIVKGGPAEKSGRLSCGDQLLRVDGQSLMGLSQDRAAEVLLQTGALVTLHVEKLAAERHGLEELLTVKHQEKRTSKNYSETSENYTRIIKTQQVSLTL
ncbi:afadin-like [Periophthalmus magnuspinnatus]|uniref:afadin-like n=1 Tax=Periophthalmus magnuspinnatus TaxID=409849 RepID=UPI00243703D2|nr:afadin-like [Periophthalmus magnuspinnatus]